MLEAHKFYQASMRHAVFCLEQLSRASQRYTAGGGTQSQTALDLFDRYASQITHVQKWLSVQHDDPEAMKLTSDYLESGREILYARLSVSEYAALLQQGISAAQYLSDHKKVVSYLCDLGQAYLVSHSVQEAQAQYTQALKLARQHDDIHGEAKAHIGLGRIKSLNKHLTEEARKHLQDAIALCQHIDDRLNEGWALQNIATIEERYGDPNHALTLIKKALSIFQTENKARYIANALKRTGAILERLQRYDDALFYLQQALELGRMLDDPHTICSTYQTMGLIYTYQDRMLDGQRAYEKALDIAQSSGFQSAAALSYSNLGWISRELSDWQTAEAYYREAMRLYEMMNYRFHALLISGDIALMNVLCGDYRTAKEQFIEILHIDNIDQLEEMQAIGMMGLAHIDFLTEQRHNLAELLACLQNHPLRRNYVVDEYWTLLHGNLQKNVNAKLQGAHQTFEMLVAEYTRLYGKVS